MRVLMIGGGKVGSYLARSLSKAGHVVTVIEDTERRARGISESADVLVFHGDGTDVEMLRSADVQRADWALGVTGLDEVNLVACQLAQTLGAKRTIARLNNPANRPTFDALGIPVVAVTDLMVKVIAQEVEVPDLSRIALIGEGQLSLCEIEIPEGFPDTPLSSLTFPQPSIFVTVVSDGRVSVPRADTRLRPGDRITAVTSVSMEKDLLRAIMHAGETES
ncbi:Trk system potassium uptake protein TrkA [hydrothermal vent metagenome]|uniref:Trk system potassium uptake protein TrkA n=1 Tax=hydrothermal vent metagenome TaxID=652676 RepID=A0A3B0SU65_9ZZZZ